MARRLSTYRSSLNNRFDRSLRAQAEPTPELPRVAAGSQARHLAAAKARHAELYGLRGQHVPQADKTLPADPPPIVEPTGRVTSSRSNPRLMTLAKPSFAVRVLNNLSYGVTPTSLAEFNALGSTDSQRLANYVDWQLDWTNISDTALDLSLIHI